MPGKYSHLKGQLTKLTGEPEYQDRVNTEKDRIRQTLQDGGKPLSASQFGLVLVDARREKTRLEKLEKDQNLIIAAMDQVLVELMEGDDFTSLKLGNGVSLTIKDDVYCQVSDKIKFHTWISETDNEDLLSVNYQTMASLVKTALIDGTPVPPGIDTYFKQSIAVRGDKNLEQE